MEEVLIQINGGIMINVECECRKRYVCEKDYLWNPASCNCVNGEYLASVMDDSSIMCDEITESYYDEKILMKKSNLLMSKFLYFTCIFINYYSIIDSC